MERTLRKLIVAGAVFTLYVASTLYIHSNFLGLQFKESIVGLLYTGASVLSLLGMMNIRTFVKNFGTKGSAVLFGILSITGIICLALSHNPILSALSFMLHFASNTLVFLSLDILIDHTGKTQNFGKIRGWYLAASNAGFMVAPLIAGFFIDRLGYGPFYIISIIFALWMIAILVFQIRIVGFSFPESGSIWTKYRQFMQNQPLRLAYISNFLLQFFYSFMVIYLPIILHKNLNLPWTTIGLIFAVMLSVFPILQIPIGYLADRVFGEKECILFGLCMVALTSFGAGFLFVPSISILGVAIILIASRIGASILEIGSEAYFFKRVQKDDINSIGFFRNTYPLAYILGPLIGSLILTGASLNSLFIILGAITLVGVIPMLRMKDTR
jgi:MFS family permease